MPSTSETPLPPPSLLLSDLHIGMHVSFVYDGEVYPGEVTDVADENNITINAMVSAGINLWKWPPKRDEISYKLSDKKAILPPPVLRNMRRNHFTFSCPLLI
jgi:hypothetical protein